MLRAWACVWPSGAAPPKRRSHSPASWPSSPPHTLADHNRAGCVEPSNTAEVLAQINPESSNHCSTPSYRFGELTSLSGEGRVPIYLLDLPMLIARPIGELARQTV